MAWLFEVKDSTGRSIHLSDERWKHIVQDHVEDLPHVEEIKDTLQHPIQRREDSQTHEIHYYRYFKYHQFSEKFLDVIVKYLNNHGFVISAYFIKRLP